MKEVTICISFLCKDGVAKSAYETFTSLSSLFTDGDKSSVNLKYVLKSVWLLLERMIDKNYDVYIKSVTLGERNKANKLDDLEAKNTTHPKGDIEEIPKI